MRPYYEQAGSVIYQGDCLDVMPALPANSVDLIATDPPYFKVKGEAWDRQWETPALFLAWMGKLVEQWHRLLKPNGSLYVFASPQMAARVEGVVGAQFNVLNHIVWRKESSRHLQAEKEALRGFFPQTERVVFAEHYGSDNIAKGEAGYVAQCDDLRGFIFEPVRSYLDGERQRSGVPHRAVIAHLGMSGHDTHFFSPVQWKLPLPDQYAAMRELFNSRGNGDFLRREYDDLRREYDDLRRPFAVTANVPYTDVWDFPTVSAYPGKHPCEKPLALMEHIIRASSRPSAVVLDSFLGSGSTAEAAFRLGRQFIGIEMDAKWCDAAASRLTEAQESLPLEQPA